MFEERLKKFGVIFGIKQREFFLIENKKTRREIYFRDTGEAINFIKGKFLSSVFKRIIYFFLKVGILQIFLKKVYLPEEFGDVIFVANMVRCFDLDKRTILVFPAIDYRTWNFIRSLKIRKEHLKKYSPKLLITDYSVPYFKEEMLNQYAGDISLPMSILSEMNNSTGFIHGDIIREHILEKDGSCVFTDWENVKKGNCKEDIMKLVKNYK